MPSQMQFDTFNDSLPINQLPKGVARSWCDPSSFVEVVGLDFGLGKVHFYKARSRTGGSVAVDQFTIWVKTLSANTLLVCEFAHLGVPRSEKSLAQPYTETELRSLYNELKQQGLCLKLAPHQHTKGMRETVSHCHPTLIKDCKKTDLNDAIALAIYVSEFNRTSLANPPKSFDRSLKRDYGIKVCTFSNTLLNAERSTGYKGKLFPSLLSIAQVVENKSGKFIQVREALSILSLLATETSSGVSVFTHKGRVPGWGLFKRFVLMMTPHHHEGGIARSNFMHYAFRRWLPVYAHKIHSVRLKVGKKLKSIGTLTDEERLARTACMKVMRARIHECFRLCIEELERCEASRLELTETKGVGDTHVR